MLPPHQTAKASFQKGPSTPLPLDTGQVCILIGGHLGWNIAHLGILVPCAPGFMPWVGIKEIFKFHFI